MGMLRASIDRIKTIFKETDIKAKKRNERAIY